MDKEDILNAFIEHFNEFIDDIVRIFPNDKKVRIVSEGFYIITQFYKNKLITLWKKDISDKYREQIDKKDYNFFIEKDWTDDIYHAKKDYILPQINRLRDTIRNMSENNKLKALKYLENLTKLSDLYNSETII